jgi:hypothetical protein
MNTRGILVVVAVGVASCHEEPTPMVVKPSEPLVQDVKSDQKPTDANATETEDQVAEDPNDGELAALEAKKASCDHAPAWTSVSRCTYEDAVYASGKIKGVRDLSLARSAAAERARRALIGGASKARLQGSEVPDVFSCKGQVYALARAPKSVVSGSFPRCDGKAIAARSSATNGCPDWTHRISWREGDTIFAVGAARLKNHVLAEATAGNRARAELTKAVLVETSANGAAASGAGSFSEVSKEMASCEGYTYVRLVAKQLEASVP